MPYHILIDYTKPVTKLSVITKMNTESSESEPLKAKYLGQGVIRLFKELSDADPADLKGKQLESVDDKEYADKDIDQDSSKSAEQPDGCLKNTVSILAVPSYFTATDVLGFIGEYFIRNSLNVRIIRSHANNRFLVLISFRESSYVTEFIEQFNGRHFNSMEPETCHAVPIVSVRFKDGSGQQLLDDPFSVSKSVLPTESLLSPSSTLPPLPTENLKELPTCPVCLERMDSSVTGLLTIPCQHTFHCQCLSKWKDDSCPVCRYSSRVRENKFISSSHSASGDEKCGLCGQTSNLWICLVCGNIACGRYNKGHAIKHFQETAHSFSMDMATQRIWDYIGDNYVHRLITTENEGKLVELPDAEVGGAGNSDKEKSTPAHVEYQNILMSQLESQREYYESKLKETADVRAMLSKENAELKDNLKRLQSQVDSFGDRMASVKELSDKAKEFKKKYESEQALSDGLMKKNEDLRKLNKQLCEKLDQNDARVSDLEDQVKDLMFFLENQAKFKDAPEDVVQGQVVIQGGGKKKNKKKK